MLVGYASQTARHGALFQSALTPTLQAALPAVWLNRRMWISLGGCGADHDSGRGTGQRDFYKYAVVEHPYGVINTKPRPLGGDSLLEKCFLIQNKYVKFEKPYSFFKIPALFEILLSSLRQLDKFVRLHDVQLASNQFLEQAPPQNRHLML